MRTRITHILSRVLLSLLLFFTLVINAPGLSAAPAGSTYPVQVTPMLIPPYSLYLSDYFSGTTERLSLTLTNRDLQQPQVRVKLRLTIACASGLTLTTHPQAVFDPIVLDAGVPTRLTMQELAPYFLPARLLTQGYMQGGKLSEGNVEFGFEVLEYNTGKILSQKNIAFGNIISPKPPKLNLPINNDIVTVNEPQQLTFQWSPQYFSTGNVEYEFVIKELMDKTASPQEAFLYSREVYRTTTTASAINYTMGEPTLEGNKRYAWCVRAVMHDGIETINRFENDGYSPVSVFDMRYDCRPLMDVQATTERGTITLRWSPQPHHLKYVVSYRRTDFDANTWYTKTTTGTSINLSDIAPGQNFTYRVGAYCDDNTPVYSAPGTISVPAEDTEFLANCGKDPQIKITNRKPKDRLNVNDIIMAGDFPVTLTRVSGSNGTFTGEGSVRIPYLFANFAVRFNNINVSEENRLIGGVIETVYDKTEKGVGNLDALDQGGTDGNIKSGITKANKTVEFTLPEKFTVQYSEELATLTFKDETGTAIGNVDIPKNPAGKPILPLTVEDKNGNVYEVHENPEKSTSSTQPYVAVKLGKQEGEIPFGSMDLNVQDEAKATVTFANDASSLYALDSWQNYYSTVGIISAGNGDPNSNFDGCKYEKIGANYWVKWKYIPPGKTDKVTAELLIKKEAKIDPAKVVFKTKAGKVFESTYNATTHTFTITLLGGEDKDGQELYAMHPDTQSGSWWNLGKLDIMSYAPVERKMVLVKTSANDNSDAATVQTELNRIYNPVGISWNVSFEQFIYNTDNIFEGKSGIISTYLPNMRTLNAAFMAAKADKLETKTAYLFLVNQTAGGDRDKQGFMPRGMQFGYINTSTTNVAAVIAHELGHGAFKLYHTFNSGYGSTAVGTQGKTENLMDYKGGTNLAKWQWDQIYDPAIINGVFDGDKEAMSFGNVPLEQKDGVMYKLDKEMSFVALSGKIIQLPKDAIIKFYCVDPTSCQTEGMLVSFLINGKKYCAKKDEITYPTSDFTGYYEVVSGSYTANKYANTNNPLTIGKQNISYIHEAKLDNGLTRIKIITEQTDVNNLQIESKNGIFEGKRVSPPSYNSNTEVQTTEQIEFASVCGSSTISSSEFDYKGSNAKCTFRLKNVNGKLQVVGATLDSSTGNAKTKNQKAQIEAKMLALANEKLAELGGLEGKSTTAVDENDANGNPLFYVASMNGKQWLETIGNLGTTIWEEAALPKTYWNQDEANYKSSTIRMPALFTGVADGAINIVSDYPQLVKLGYDVATKEEVRTGIWNAVKSISPSSVKTMAKDAIKQKIANYNFSDKPYLGNHELGKDGVTVVSAMMGAGFLKAGDEALENSVKTTGEKVKEAIQTKLDDIEEFMKTPDFLKKLDDAFGRYKGKLSRTDWEAKYKTLFKNREKGAITESKFNELLGSDATHLEIQTGSGKRYVDNVLDGVGKEIKSGKVSWSSYKDQVLKDIEIVQTQAKKIKKIEWHCFDEVDDTFIKNVKDELKKANLSENDFIIIKY